MIPVIGLIVGIIMGYFLNINIPDTYSLYIPVAILAAMDTVFGGARASLEKKFDSEMFVSGFFGNVLIAAILTYLGERLNIPMYLAAVVVFGGRLFNNFAAIRRLLIEKGRKKIKHKEE